MSLDIYLGIKGMVHPDQPEYYGSIWSRNITHNLGRLWAALGCYEALYESDGLQGKDILPALEESVMRLTTNRADYLQYNPSNGWGSIDHAIVFLSETIEACKAYPLAYVRVSR